MERRDAALLDKLERAVFGRPRSPYSQLLRAAGCEPSDVLLPFRTLGPG